MSERSASAIQIAERQARIDAMLNLAIKITTQEIQKLGSKLTHTQILEIMKQKDFPITPFLNEYMMQPDCFVKDRTAKEYFDKFVNRLNPLFVRTKVGHFRLSDVPLSNLIHEVNRGKTP